MPEPFPKLDWPDNSDLQAAMARYGAGDPEDRHDLAYHLVVNDRQLLIPLLIPPGAPEDMRFASLYQWPNNTVLHVYTARDHITDLPQGAVVVPHGSIQLLELCAEEGIGMMLIDPDEPHGIAIYFDKGRPILYSWPRLKEAISDLDAEER